LRLSVDRSSQRTACIVRSPAGSGKGFRMRALRARRCFASFVLLAVSMPLLAQPGAAPSHASSNWPERPIRLVIPYPPGGNADTLGRVLAERLRDHLKG